MVRSRMNKFRFGSVSLALKTRPKMGETRRHASSFLSVCHPAKNRRCTKHECCTNRRSIDLHDDAGRVTYGQIFPSKRSRPPAFRPGENQDLK